MREQRLTQSVLADQLGVTQPTISRYLTGQIPKADDFLLLVKILKVEPAWLLGGKSSLPHPGAGSHREVALEDSPPYKAKVAAVDEWRARALNAEKKLKAIEDLLKS